MCGRGIDQVLAQPCSAEICEAYMRSVESYVLLAERANGPIPGRNGASYVWGAALDELVPMQPDARIVNLETAVTRSNDRANKGINYRMSPENAECLVAAGIDCCVLANNHALDWGRSGLLGRWQPCKNSTSKRRVRAAMVVKQAHRLCSILPKSGS
jgi:poly-gamma-glutamate synthesis protein (capsule biosynthesis protein)